MIGSPASSAAHSRSIFILQGVANFLGPVVALFHPAVPSQLPVASSVNVYAHFLLYPWTKKHVESVGIDERQFRHVDFLHQAFFFWIRLTYDTQHHGLCEFALMVALAHAGAVLCGTRRLPTHTTPSSHATRLIMLQSSLLVRLAPFYDTSASSKVSVHG